MELSRNEMEKLDEAADQLSRFSGGKIELRVYGARDPKDRAARILAARIQDYLIKQHQIERQATKIVYAGSQDEQKVVTTLRSGTNELFETTLPAHSRQPHRQCLASRPCSWVNH